MTIEEGDEEESDEDGAALAQVSSACQAATPLLILILILILTRKRLALAWLRIVRLLPPPLPLPSHPLSWPPILVLTVPCLSSRSVSQCGKGLMTMGFEVPLGGDGGDDGDSCLDVFFGYVRRGIANEVLRALRRWALDGSERDSEGNTAVHIAAIHGSKHIVEVALCVCICARLHACGGIWAWLGAACTQLKACCAWAALGEGGLRLLEPQSRGADAGRLCAGHGSHGPGGAHQGAGLGSI